MSLNKKMKERDTLKLNCKNLTPSEKRVQHEQYKRTRNRVNSMIKADVIKYNEDRITKAADINEVWKRKKSSDKWEKSSKAKGQP